MNVVLNIKEKKLRCLKKEILCGKIENIDTSKNTPYLDIPFLIKSICKEDSEIKMLNEKINAKNIYIGQRSNEIPNFTIEKI